MTTYWNKKYNFGVQATRIEPGSSCAAANLEPPFMNLFDELPGPYWCFDMQGRTFVISDELFQRFFVPEPAIA